MDIKDPSSAKGTVDGSAPFQPSPADSKWLDQGKQALQDIAFGSVSFERARSLCCSQSVNVGHRLLALSANMSSIRLILSKSAYSRKQRAGRLSTLVHSTASASLYAGTVS